MFASAIIFRIRLPYYFDCWPPLLFWISACINLASFIGLSEAKPCNSFEPGLLLLFGTVAREVYFGVLPSHLFLFWAFALMLAQFLLLVRVLKNLVQPKADLR